jgi:hypothetical protein
MYNRYVDGLNTLLPESDADYAGMGRRLATVGYKYPPFPLLGMVRRMMQKATSKRRNRTAAWK